MLVISFDVANKSLATSIIKYNLNFLEDINIKLSAYKLRKKDLQQRIANEYIDSIVSTDSIVSMDLIKLLPFTFDLIKKAKRFNKSLKGTNNYATLFQENHANAILSISSLKRALRVAPEEIKESLKEIEKQVKHFWLCDIYEKKWFYENAKGKLVMGRDKHSIGDKLIHFSMTLLPIGVGIQIGGMILLFL